MVVDFFFTGEQFRILTTKFLDPSVTAWTVTKSGNAKHMLVYVAQVMNLNYLTTLRKYVLVIHNAIMLETSISVCWTG